MKADTRINVGAVIGMGMLLVSVMVFQSASTNARIDGLRDEVNVRFDRQDARVDRLDSRIDSLRADMREDHAAIHVRLDAHQGSLLEIGQRLARVEGRLGMPRGGDADAASQN